MGSRGWERSVVRKRKHCTPFENDDTPADDVMYLPSEPLSGSDEDAVQCWLVDDEKFHRNGSWRVMVIK